MRQIWHVHFIKNTCQK